MAGAATVGRLIIDLSANVAQLRTDMQSATGVVEGASSAITGAINTAKTALGALGIGIGLVDLKNWATDVIDTAGALNDFAQKTGSSVTALSALVNQAKISDVPLGDLENLTLKLAVNLRDMGDEGKAAGRALEYLGVTSKDPATALQDVADALDKYADGAGKAAIAKDLFGRNGPQYLDFLHDLAEKHRIGATRTAEQADAADRLGENWRQLKIEGDFLAGLLLDKIVPAFVDFTNKVIALKGQGFSLTEALFAPPDLESALTNIGLINTQIGWLKTLIENLPSWNPWAEDLNTALTAMNNNLGKQQIIRDTYIDLWIKKLGYIGDAHDQMVQNSAASLSKLEIDYGTTAQALKQADFTSNIADFERQLDKLTGADGGMSNFARAMDLIIQAQRDGKIVSGDQAAALLAVAGELDNATIKAKDYKSALDEWLGQEKAYTGAQDRYAKSLSDADIEAGKFVQSLRDIVIAANDEVELLGATPEKIALVTAQRKIQKEVNDKLLEVGGLLSDQRKQEIIDEGKAAEAAVAASIAKKKAYEDWLGLLQDTTRGVSNFIVDWVENGSSAFKNLWQNFKKWALEALAEIAAKQIVVSIVGALGLGGSAGAAAAGGLQVGGAGSQLLTLLGLGNSATGGAGAGLAGSLLNGVLPTALGSGGGFLGLGGIGATGINAIAGEGAMLAAGGTISGGAGALASLAPLVPWLAIAGIAAPFIISAFSQKGGPMDRQYGTSTGNLTDFGTLSSTHKLVGTDAVVSPALAAMATGLGTQYDTIIRLLGGTGSAQFGVYTSMDPKGTAPSNVDITANVGGKAVFSGDNFNVGRTQADVDAELKLQASKAILAALKASDLPEVVIEFLGVVDLGTSTLETIVASAAVLTKLPEDLQRKFVDAVKLDPSVINSMSEFATAYVGLQTVLNRDPQAEALKATSAGFESNYSRVIRLRGELTTLVDAYDGSTAKTEELTTATNLYVNAQVAALIEIANLKTSLSTLFGDSIRDIDLAIMTTTERSTFLKNEALQNIDLLKKTTDPVQIEKLGKLINTDLVASFNLLSPEEQRREHDWFIQQLTYTGELVDTQLTTAGGEVTEQGKANNTVLDNIRIQLNAAADKQFSAAQALDGAAIKLGHAVDRFDGATTTMERAADVSWGAANNMPSHITVTVEPQSP